MPETEEKGPDLKIGGRNRWREGDRANGSQHLIGWDCQRRID